MNEWIEEMNETTGPKRRKTNQNTLEEADESEASSENGCLQHEVFFNDLILETIFGYLGMRELLQCSIVCHKWNVLARNFLVKNRRCLLTFDLDENTHKDLVRLTTVLANATYYPLPYTGLALSSSGIHSSGRDFQLTRRQRSWASFTNIVLQRLGDNFKVLSLKLASMDHQVASTVAAIFVRTHKQIEVLRLEGDIPEGAALLSAGLGPFESLKELEFNPDTRHNYLEDYLKKLLLSSPTVRKLRGFVNPDWLTLPFFIRIEGSGTVKDFDCDLTADTLPVCLQFAQRKPALEKLTFSRFPRGGRFRLWLSEAEIYQLWEVQERLFGQMTTISRLLLESSCDTLRELKAQHEDLVALTVAGLLPVCQNLTCLKLRIDEDQEARKFLKGVDLARFFPRLKRVEVERVTLDRRVGPGFPPSEFEDASSESASSSVRVFVLIDADAMSPRPSLLLRSAQLFPNLRHFCLDSVAQSFFCPYIDKLCSVWNDLESITISKIPLRSIHESLDHTVCGITIAEAEHLKTFQVDILKSCHMVPTNFSLLNKSRLKIFRLEIQHQRERREHTQKDPGSILFSSVSGACGFSRMPNLTLEVYQSCKKHVLPAYRFNLNHLRQFVKVRHLPRSFSLEKIGTTTV